MPHLHPLYDSDPHFSINADTRTITFTSPEKLILIQGDHNSEIVTFDIPRYIDGHDMMLSDVVQVHYINIDSNNSHNRNSGIYEVLDLQVSPDDENFCVCSWLISKNATLFVGPLTFTLRFACTNASKLVYVWNTAIYNGIPVSNGIDNSDIVVEEYADILESWYWEFVSAGTTGVNVVVEAKDKAVSEIEAFLSQYGGIMVSETEPESNQIVVWLNSTDSTLRIRNQETGEFEALTSIKGEKGDPGDVVNITQATGSSETLVMSQKAVTDNLNSLDSRVTTNETNISDISSRVTTNEGNISTLQSKVSEMDTALGNEVLFKSNITQATGSSETLVMSQKAVTDNLNSLDSRVTTNETNISDISSRVTTNEGNISTLQSKVSEMDTALGGKYISITPNSTSPLNVFDAGSFAEFTCIKANSNYSSDSIYITLSQNDITKFKYIRVIGSLGDTYITYLGITTENTVVFDTYNLNAAPIFAHNTSTQTQYIHYIIHDTDASVLPNPQS